MFLLTTEQARDIPNVRACSEYSGCDDNAWWLCSPPTEDSSHTTYVAGVLFNSIVRTTAGFSVEHTNGVRPALKLDLSKVVFNSATNTFSPGQDTHNFTYSVSGATITATCSESYCTLLNNKAELTIVAPELTTFGETGKSASATLGGLEAFDTSTGKGIAQTDIMYAGRDGTTYAESADAPTNAGKYTAKITVEGQTASVDYDRQGQSHRERACGPVCHLRPDPCRRDAEQPGRQHAGNLGVG